MKLLLATMFFLATIPAQAYIGPGMGAGAIATILGVIGAIALAIVGVIYYPLKRFLKKRRKKNESDGA